MNTPSSPFDNSLHHYFNDFLNRTLKEGNGKLSQVFSHLWQATEAGHACLPLNELIDGDEKGSSAISLQKLSESLMESGLCSCGASFKPLILEGESLYLHKYYVYEKRISDFVSGLIASEAESGNSLPPSAKELLERLFPSNEEVLQKRAVEAMLKHRFCILTGGPGTGKTSTLAKALIALAVCSGKRVLARVVAPTGKAMKRAQAAFFEKLDEFSGFCSAEERERLSMDFSTVHSLIYNAEGEFNPIEKKNLPFMHYLFIDEASMLDLSMLAKIVEHIRPTCRLVLIGDSRQLNSVRAGSVLSDLLQALGENSPCAVRLTHNFRFNSSKGLSRLAEALLKGENGDFFETLSNPSFPEVSLYPPLTGKNLNEFLGEKSQVFAGMKGGEPEAILQKLSRSAILTAMRRGSTGSNEINRLLAERLSETGVNSRVPFFFEGMPVMINKNLYSLNLPNGEQGVILYRENRLFAVFPAQDGDKARFFPLHKIRDIEPSFAVTVHKSQGSEFEQVDLILPERLNRVLSMELIYTAITRARKSLRIFSSKEVLEGGLQTPQKRFSGLKEKLEKKLNG